LETLLFGVAGLPLGDGKKYDYASGIAYLKRFGLDAMELPFVRSVNVTEKNRTAILQSKKENDFYLSAHGSYYLNLNADTPQKQQESLERIHKGAAALAMVEGRSLVFHAGYYLGKSPDETYRTIRDNLLTLPQLGVEYRLETTGKPTQFGALDELVSLCREVPSCKICLDFSHIHARGNGALRSEKDFAAILRSVADGLGSEALADLHIHLSGIAYGPKGEKEHLALEKSDFPYKACLRALRDAGAKGCVICESPLVEHDALLLKTTYDAL
jgi:deoxyribonuclease-4